MKNTKKNLQEEKKPTLKREDIFRKIVRSANKEVGYPCSIGKYFLGSLPLGSVIEQGESQAIILKINVNVTVKVFNVFSDNLEDKEDAKSMIGTKIWSWATEVKLIRLGNIHKGEQNND